MSDIATVVLSGRVGQDPERKKINDTDLGTFSLAVDQYNGKKPKTTAWWRVEVWGGMCNLLDYIKKGSAIVVSGEIRQDKVASAGGEEKVYYKVRANNIKLPPKSDGDVVKAAAKSQEGQESEAEAGPGF